MATTIRTERGFDISTFACASQFYQAANEISEFDCKYPYIVNLAFAIELCIKSLDVTRKYEKDEDSPFSYEIEEPQIHTQIRSHSLLKMFKKLPDINKSQLLSSYFEIYELDLHDDLSAIENAFVDYRYLYEKQSTSINVSALKRVSDFLYEFINSRGKLLKRHLNVTKTVG